MRESLPQLAVWPLVDQRSQRFLRSAFLAKKLASSLRRRENLH
ncbi:unnamed protein product, partial [Strongylus vulgaris]